MGKRVPCAFTETAVKRMIKAVRAAGETPGRVVVTKDGFAVELLSDAGDHHIRPNAAAANTWDGLYDHEDEASATSAPVP